MNISEAIWPIATKFYLKHHWDGRKAALRLGPDPIRTLVSMATDNSHRVITWKTVSPFFSVVFYLVLFKLSGNENMHEFEFRPDTTTDCGVSCP